MAAIQPIVAEVERSKLPLATGLVRLNKALKDFSQIAWCGTFGDLLVADEPFPREVRAGFRGTDKVDDDKAVAPIATEEVEEFIEYLQTYGV